MTESSAIFLIVLVLGFILGWSGSKYFRRTRSKRKGGLDELYNDYFVGLNYLLHDEPDEAIDTFIEALEVNGQTIETHLALGTLLRRRGKVDKAIKVHQALLARSGLTGDLADSTRLELARDYIAAGLLDRAERLAKELIKENSDARPEALFQLVTIYEFEKEWQLAIDTVQILLNQSRHKKDKNMRVIAAHYCCELAELELKNGNYLAARGYVKRAFQFDRINARASFQLADIERGEGNYAIAVKELERIANHHPEYLSEIVKPLSICYEQGGDSLTLENFSRFLSTQLGKNPRALILLQLVELVRQDKGLPEAITTLAEGLNQHKTLQGAGSLLQLHSQLHEGELQSHLRLVARTISEYLDNRPNYQCIQCGFKTRKLYWRCPSCQKWDTISPILGLVGE